MLDCEASPPNSRLAGWNGGWALVFPLLALLLLGDVLWGAHVLLPAEYLKGFSPWKESQTQPLKGHVSEPDSGKSGRDGSAQGAEKGSPDASGAPDATRDISREPQWNVLQWDGMAQFLPWRVYSAREMTAGRIPLWDPYVLCGTPFLANSQSAPLYPLHWLYYLPFRTSTAERLGWLAFLHLSLAGLFAYWLALDFGIRPLAAAVGGVAFELSGFAVAWLELPSFLTVACWIPLLMLCIGRAVRHGSVRWTLGAAGAAGMMLLGGHLQIALYGLLAAGCVWVWEAVALLPGKGPERLSQRMRRFGGAIAVGVTAIGLGFALAAPQFLSSLEFSRISHRVGPPTPEGFKSYVGFALPLLNWITLLVPDYYGLPGRNNFWPNWKYGPPNVMEYAGHVGMIAFVLAVVGLLWGRRMTPRVWLVAGIGILALLLASGSLPAQLMYYAIPGVSQSGSPGRALVLFCLAQSLLAALGCEWLLWCSEEHWKDALVPLLIAAGVAIAVGAGLHFAAQSRLEGAQVLPNTAGPALKQALFAVVGLVAFAGLLLWLMRENTPLQRQGVVGGMILLLTAGNLLYLGNSYNQVAAPQWVYPSTPLTEALEKADGRVATLNREWRIDRQPAALLPPDCSLYYGWRDVQGYDSLFLGTYRRLMDFVALPETSASPNANGNMVFVKHVASPLLPLLGARYEVSQKPLHLPEMSPAAGFPEGPPYAYRYALSAPEAFRVQNWEASDADAGLKRLSRLRARQVTWLAEVAPGSATMPTATGPPAQPLPAALERRSPVDLVATTEAKNAGLLVLLESSAPGWKATMRRPGQPPHPAPIVRVDAAFQGVFVDPGESIVEWRYEPASFRVGLFAALAALSVLLAGFLLTRRSGAAQE